jgi:DNA-binding MarR family transcriptional regulator
LSRSRTPAAQQARDAEVRRLTSGYLPHALSRLMNALNLKLTDVLRPLDLSAQQFRVMQVVFVREVVSITEISRDAVIEQSVVSRIADQLEKRGFVKRRKRSTNARVVEVTLTPVGLAVFESIVPHAHTIVDHATEVLSSADQATLLSLLSRVLDHVRPVDTAQDDAARLGSARRA